MRRSLWLCLGLLGCEGGVLEQPVCPPTFALGEDGVCVFDEASVGELMRTFRWAGLVRINAEPFEQITNPDVIRNVYVAPLPVVQGMDTVALYELVDPETHAELPYDFPLGTVIVHERVDRIEGSTVQIKREAGYVNEAGGAWWFGKFFDDGTPDEDPCDPCWGCHTPEQNPGTEGLWGVPRDALPG